MAPLDGRTAIVTGAAGAIGRQTVRQLLDAGVGPLAIVDLPGSGIEEVAAEFTGAASTVLGFGIDVSDRNAFGAVCESLPSVDVLVNVAGHWQIIDFVNSNVDDWQAMISSNLFTAMVTCHAVLPGMIARGEGVIVNFASTAGEYGSIRPSAAYAAAKGGVIAFTKSLAREVSPLGVRVNAVSPGPIDTPALQAASVEARREAEARTLVGRLGEPRDIASAVIYLASDASRFVTGTVLQVNGGSLL